MRHPVGRLRGTTLKIENQAVFLDQPGFRGTYRKIAGDAPSACWMTFWSRVS